MSLKGRDPQVENHWPRDGQTLTHLSLCLPFPAVPLAALVSSVNAPRLNCRPQIWNLVAGPPMGQGPYAAGRDGANVDAAAAVGRALGVCASVMMPAVSDMRASSVEVPGVLGEAGVGEPRANFKGCRMCLAQSRCWASCVRVITLCMTCPQALDTASVECVTVTPTARAEHVSAVRTWTAVSVPKEGSAADMGTAGATVASARTATTGLCVTSASAASHHVSSTGEAAGLYLGSWGTVNCLCVLFEGVGEG